MPDNDNALFKLPPSTAQPLDVGHLIRELNLIDEHLNQVTLRDPTKQVIVKPSVQLKEILEANNISLNDKDSRTKLIATLNILRKSAPVVNISFGAEASRKFIAKVTEWFRQEVDPYCLIVVGLEPSIGVGSIVRTTNKVFDLSLKKHL
ncbi:MAG TPA: hypothetical protein VGF75_05930, partial [Candidatus Saccharimonadales bacterium]